MTEHIMGIDPGLSGGVAVLRSMPIGVEWIDGKRMPTHVVGSKTHVKARDLQQFIQHWNPDVIVIEQVNAMPKQGVSSTFTFGMAYGAVCALADAYAVPVEFVTPRRWKDKLGLSNDKRASLDAASRFWPDAVDWSVKANDGIAEAALIAKWYTLLRQT